jgi:hypothetical protein
MFIDHDITELINVDLNLTIFESPCILLGVHYQDELGTL